MKKLLSIAILSLLMLTSIAYALGQAKSQPITLKSETGAKGATITYVKAIRQTTTGGERYSQKCIDVGQSWCQRLGRCINYDEKCDVLPSRLGISKPGIVRVKNVAGLARLEKPLPRVDYSLQPRRQRMDRPKTVTTGGKRTWSNLATPVYIGTQGYTN